MIDIHSHILPGLDDGAEDIYDSLEMARMAVQSGVTRMVATPHCNIPGLYKNYFGDGYIEVFAKTAAAIQREGIPLELLPGMEAFATPNLPDLLVGGKIMPLNQSRYVLVEFSFDEDPDFADDLLRRLKEVGAKPVVAHAERYEFVQRNPQLVYEWRKKGYVIQVNKNSFLGGFGHRVQEAAYQLLGHNLVSVVASDAHSPIRRTPYMDEVVDELLINHTEKYVDLLMNENPHRICENRPIVKFKARDFLREDER